jgi:hypothetical protein
MNNGFNRMPPDDRSFQGTYNQPFNVTNYNVFGREYYLTATYRVGRGNPPLFPQEFTNVAVPLVHTLGLRNLASGRDT